MKYANIHRWLTLPLLLFMVVGLLFPSSACTPLPLVTTLVSISPASQTAAPGQTFTVDVLVDPRGLAIAGAQFDLSFDPSLVTVVSVAEGNLLNQTGLNTFFLPGTIDNDAGTITGVACAITTPGGTVAAPGTLATVTFSAGTTEGTSPLHLSNVVVGNKAGQALSQQIMAASVTVSAE